MTTTYEIESQLNEVKTALSELRSTNEQMVSLEQKGSSDPIMSDKLDKINNFIDTMSVANQRPVLQAASHPQESLEHKSAFSNYMRKGDEKALMRFEQKGISDGATSDSGFLVTARLQTIVDQALLQGSPVRRLASVQNITTDGLDVVSATNGFDASWVSESEPRNSTNTIAVSRKTITAFELTCQPKATQKLIDDLGVDIESWLANRVSESFLQKENNAFLHGDGVSKPVGMLSYVGTGTNQIEQVTSGDASKLVSGDALVKLIYSLDDQYTANASLLMNRTTIQAVRVMKDANGQYMWQSGLALGQPDTILGFPVYQVSDMPTIAANAVVAVFGDISKAYQIVDRTNIRVMRDPFTEKPFVKFYTTKRVGGDVVNTKAVKVLKIAV